MRELEIDLAFPMLAKWSSCGKGLAEENHKPPLEVVLRSEAHDGTCQATFFPWRRTGYSAITPTQRRVSHSLDRRWRN